MITDRNEAFMHNSCKKLAQLGKVIYAMSNQIHDRQEEAEDIQNEYENLIQNVVNDYHEKAENIAKDLIHFRKKLVDESCKEFGQLYKQQKIDLANIKSNYVERLNQIITEGQNLIKILKESQQNTLNSAAITIKAADNFMTDINSHQQRPSTSKREIRSSVQPIFDKMELAQKESNNRIKQMNVDFKNKTLSLKKEIGQFVRNELFNRKEQFQMIKNQLNEIYSEMNLIKNDFVNSIRKEKEFYKNKHQVRDSLLKETREAILDASKNMKNINSSNSKENKQFSATIANLKNQLQRKKIEHQGQIQSLKRQTKEQKRLISQFNSKVDIELRRKKDELDSSTQDQINSQKVQAKKRQKLYKIVINNINDCETDTQKLIESMQKFTDESIKETEQKQILFHEKIELQEQMTEKRLSDELEVFKQRCEERASIIETATEAQNEISKEKVTKQTKRNCHLRHEIKREAASFDEAYEASKGKFQQEYDEAYNFNQNRLSQKTTENENSMIRRTNDKKKRKDDLINGFQENIKKIENDIKTKNDQILSKAKEEEDEKLFLKEAFREQEMEKSKMIAKNDFLTKRIIELKDEEIKLEEIYQNDLSSYQKAMRQHERKKKVEEQKLDEEFEMKIQIAQVNLNNSIENISKLYEADENQRGCAVIEAIRKVRDVSNRVKEYRIAKQHELSKAMKEFDKEKQILVSKINDYKCLDKELELKNKMAQIQEKSESKIKEINDLLSSEKSRINSKINLEKNKIEIQLNEIKVKKNLENENYSNQVIQFQNDKKKLETDRDNKINSLDQQYNQKAEELNSEHQNSVEKLKVRIESARKTKQDVLDKQNSEIENVKNNNWSEIKSKQTDYDSRKDNMFSSDKNRCEMLTEKIDQLSKDRVDLELKFYDMPIRPYEEKSIDTIKKRISNDDEKIKNTFETFYITIHDAPEKAHDVDISSEQMLSNSSSQQRESPSPLVNRPSTAANSKKNYKINFNYNASNATTNTNNNVKNIKSSRKEKTPRVIMTPTMNQDQKLKKRSQIVSPQFM